MGIILFVSSSESVEGLDQQHILMMEYFIIASKQYWKYIWILVNQFNAYTFLPCSESYKHWIGLLSDSGHSGYGPIV